MKEKKLIIDGKTIFKGQREAVFRELYEFIEQHLKIGYRKGFLYTDGEIVEAILIYRKYQNVRIELHLI